jgi:hypothetical protein
MHALGQGSRQAGLSHSEGAFDRNVSRGTHYLTVLTYFDPGEFSAPPLE